MALRHAVCPPSCTCDDHQPTVPGRQEVLRPGRTELAAEEMEPEAAYRLVHDELMLDGNARLNLATFATSWMEPQAQALMNGSLAKNAVDREEYPQTAAMEERCVRMIARLWRAPDPGCTVGCSTTGSSEATMLAGLALKTRWQQRRRAAGEPCGRPNLLGDGAQLPVLAFHLDADTEGFTVFEVSRALRERGWQVPAYTFPKNREELAVLRVVVRHGFSGELAQLFLDDLRRGTEQLAEQPLPVSV
ncbi:hypothetical protein GXW83_02460 [Streptacidiphilus sp. PB12-B1b]|uniref:pyridoxal-dependent decarboxylase n=1 Tax=Streptacidiphilus sp. PB12-B1b TaxID=2705012 RepID=UPI0015FD9C96|nr:pyridoxal-dependent decarboxylase [Streptacidiphilus sp. PB12-B1b]QMU74803.1 hypothetical protein GXW83_02460 [Streptacidiphilus sp. PB12-B1b]